jgi:acyl carrier protein
VTADVTADVRQFLIDTLREMNYPTDAITDDQPLGAGGIELESLGVAELGLRLEESYGISFTDEENEQIADMTFGQFVAEVVGRVEPAAAGRA